MSEKVRVRFGVTLRGHYRGELEVTRGEFERMGALDDTQLANKLADFIEWRDIECDVDDCDEFEEMPCV